MSNIDSSSPPPSPIPSTPPTPLDEGESSSRSKNWGMDDDVVMLEGVKEFGVGRWEDTMNRSHSMHKSTNVLDPAKFRKRYNDISDKAKSKYFKPYKRVKFTKPKGLKVGKDQQQIKEAEEIHEGE